MPEETKSKSWYFESIQLTMEFNEPVSEKEAVAECFDRFERAGFGVKISGKPSESSISGKQKEILHETVSNEAQ